MRTGNDDHVPVHLKNCANPLHATDAATKAYVDGFLTTVVAATYQSLALADLTDPDLIVDGAPTAAGAWILLFGQDDPRENGIYVVGSSGGRAPGFEDGSPCRGMLVGVLGPGLAPPAGPDEVVSGGLGN